MAESATLRRPVVVLGLLVLTAALYAQHLSAPAVYEDHRWFASVSTPPGGDWPVPGRQLTMQTYYWTWQAVGTDVRFYHAGNLALHLLNGLLVYGVAVPFTGGAAAVVAAGVFWLHPLSVEAVAYLSARTDLLMTTSVLLALWTSVRLMAAPAWSWGLWLTGVLIALWMAAASKEIGLMGVPLLLLTLARWPGSSHGRTLLLSVVSIVAGIAAGLAWNVAPAFFDMPTRVGGSVYSLFEYASLQNVALWHLLALVVWPVGFSIDHDIVGLSAQWGIAAGLLTMQAVVILLWTWRRAPLVAWAIAWVALSVAPRFVFRTNEFITEPQLYLAMVAVSVAIGAAVTPLVSYLWGPRSTMSSFDFWRDLRCQWQSGHVHGGGL